MRSQEACKLLSGTWKFGFSKMLLRARSSFPLRFFSTRQVRKNYFPWMFFFFFFSFFSRLWQVFLMTSKCWLRRCASLRWTWWSLGCCRWTKRAAWIARLWRRALSRAWWASRLRPSWEEQACPSSRPSSSSKSSHASIPPSRSWSTSKTPSQTLAFSRFFVVLVFVSFPFWTCSNKKFKWASDEQKARWLPRLAKDTVASFCLSEWGSGSDAFALKTRATPVAGGGWELNGSKGFWKNNDDVLFVFKNISPPPSAWITNSKEAGLFVVFATTDPALGYKGISAFVVDKRDTPGLTVQKPENKLGIRASSTCEVSLQGVRVPAENVLGPLGKVFFFSFFFFF